MNRFVNYLLVVLKKKMFKLIYNFVFEHYATLPKFLDSVHLKRGLIKIKIKVLLLGVPRQPFIIFCAV